MVKDSFIEPDKWTSNRKVFLSHSEKDEALHLTLRMVLAHAQINVWDSSRISPGRSLADQLRDAMHECRLCVFLATPKSIASEWCSAELGAFWGAGKPVLVFLADSDLEDSVLPPQFRGAFVASKPEQLIVGIKAAMAEPKVFDPMCKIINTREDVYLECLELINSATTIRDTSWGKKARGLAEKESIAREKYRQAIDTFVRSGRDYRELITPHGANEDILEAWTKKEAYPNYLCRTVSADVADFPMVDMMIADSNRVLFSYPTAHNSSHSQYVYAESEALADLFIQYYSDIWESSKDILKPHP